MKKTISISICLTILYCAIVVSCKPVEKAPKTLSIAQLRDLAAQSGQKMLEQEYEIEGYYWDETVPMLLSNLKWLDLNTPMPDSNFVLLTGPGIDKLKEKPMKPGSLVKIKGKINPRGLETKDGKFLVPVELELICPELPKLIKLPLGDIRVPTFVPICQRFPFLCKDWPFVRGKYAILYSGGVNSSSAYKRYWNDLKFMYFVLKTKYGYSDANIVVVYKNGTGEDSDMPVDYAATTTGLNNAISFLQGKITSIDDLFVFITNHGGGYHQGGGHQGVSTAANGGGLSDTSGDEVDTYRYDETIFYFGQSNNTLSDDDLAVKINSLPYKRRILLLEPCFSGGLLRDLRGPNSVAASACHEFEYSWGGPTVDGASYDMFSYYFTEALNKATPGGTALTTNPDTNGDGKVSILEAFLYAKAKDTAAETPLLDDNNDGVGSNTPSATSGDGVFAHGVKL